MVQGLGERLREQRTAIHMSQRKVASHLGLSATVIYNYEREERTPSLEVLLKLCYLYRCDLNYLCGLTKTPNISLDTSMLNSEQTHQLQVFLNMLQLNK